MLLKIWEENLWTLIGIEKSMFRREPGQFMGDLYDMGKKQNFVIVLCLIHTSQKYKSSVLSKLNISYKSSIKCVKGSQLYYHSSYQYWHGLIFC